MEATNGLVAINPNLIQPYPSELKIDEVPVIALRHKSRSLLSRLLNPTKILLSEEGFPRDWRGIAHLAGIQHQSGIVVSNDHDPMSKILQLWTQEEPKSATIGQLQKFLGLIDRWDVADDIRDIFVEDAKAYVEAKHKKELEEMLIDNIPTPKINADNNIITIDDVNRSQQGLGPQKYDAFVLFADEDIDFATELIVRMEDCGFKLCVKERDLVGGISFEHEAIMRLISDRCNRLIVVVSPAFLRSPANTFFVNFAQALGIEQGRRKIVPCLYERCELPPTLSFYFLLNYQRSGRFWNFWEKLRDSIQSTPTEQRNTTVPRITITEVTESQSSGVTIAKENTPIKVPRKRREKQKLAFSEGLKTGEHTSVSPSSSPEEKRQTTIMPPAPRLRSSASMINLNTTQYESSWTKSNSNLALNSNNINNNVDQKTIPKLKWYKKILSTSSISNAITHDSGKEKTKKKWFGKKVAVYNG